MKLDCVSANQGDTMKFRVKLDCVLEAKSITEALVKLGNYYTGFDRDDIDETIFVSESIATIEPIKDDDDDKILVA